MVGSESGRQPSSPSLADALAAVLVLILLVSASFLLFGDKATFGPNQVALTLAATLGPGAAMRKFGGRDQAAAGSSAACTGSPSRKRTPWITWGSRCEPSSRRQLRSADFASLSAVAKGCVPRQAALGLVGP